MAIGIVVQVTHTGLVPSSILLNDVFTSVEGPAGFRKAGPVYVPVGGMIELVYTESVARSFEFGAIRSFITTGHVTAALVVPGGSSSYTPDDPTQWAPGVPTTLAGALDQMAASGAGHFQKARDPLSPPPVWPAAEFYFSATGSDDSPTNDGLSPATAFASLARVLQSIAEMPENTNGDYIGIEAGAGVFKIPTYVKFPPNCFVAGVYPTTTSTYLVDASQPVNTTDTGNRIVLNTTALASTVPTGTFIQMAATTAPGGPLLGEVYLSDNSGPGGKLVLWLIAETSTFVVNIAAGTSVDILEPFPTIFEYDTGTVVDGGQFYYIHHRCIGGALIRTEVEWNGAFHYICRIDVNSSVGAAGCDITTAYITRAVAWYGPGRFSSAWAVWDIENYPISLAVGIYPRGGGHGLTTLEGEHSFKGTLIAIAVGPGGILAPDALIRVGDMLYGGSSPGWIFVMNSPNGSDGMGGTSILGDILEPRTLAGVIIPCLAAKFVEVGVLKNTQVTVGSGSNITLGGVLNPMTIMSTYAASDASGTRLIGGNPVPGGWGSSIQFVSTSGQTWDGVSATVVLDTSAIGPAGTFLLPAIGAGGTGKGVTNGADFTLITEDASNSVDVTPFAGDKINEVAAAVPTGAARTVTRYICRTAANNWMK